MLPAEAVDPPEFRAPHEAGRVGVGATAGDAAGVAPLPPHQSATGAAHLAAPPHGWPDEVREEAARELATLRWQRTWAVRLAAARDAARLWPVDLDLDDLLSLVVCCWWVVVWGGGCC